MADNKENMKQAMKELLGMVGFETEAGTPPSHTGKEATAAAPESAESGGLRQERKPMPQEASTSRRATGRGLFRSSGKQKPPESVDPQTLDKGGNSPLPPDTSMQRRGGSKADGGTPGNDFHYTFEQSQDGTDYEKERPYKSASSVPFVTTATTTIISPGTSVFGDIRAEGEVEIQGKLKGNLETMSSIRITGKVLGDIKGESVELASCAVQGNIHAAGSVRVDQSTVIVGDVTAANLTTDGKMKGNVLVEKTAIFQKNAVLAGNVTATLVSMSEGAKIQGAIRITQGSETSSLFGSELDI